MNFLRSILFCLLSLPALASNLAYDVSKFTGTNWAALVGHSIVSGYPSYTTAVAGGPSGDIAFNLAHVLNTNSAGLLTVTNFGFPGQDFAGLAATNVPLALLGSPRVLIVGCGVNDVQNGRPWSAVNTDLNTIYAQCRASNVIMVLCQNMPWTAGSDAQALTLRTWNTNFAYFVGTNVGTALITLYDAFGQLRVSTGFLDDLKTAYNSGDNVHITAAAYSLWSTIILTNLQAWFSTHNMLPNSSFEAGTGRGWISFGVDNHVSYGMETNVAGLMTNTTGLPHGNNGFLVQGGARNISRLMALTNGTYTVSGYGRLATGSGDTTFRAGLINGVDLTSSYTPLSNITLNATWRRWENQFTVTSNANYWFVAYGGFSSASFVLDAVQVEIGNIATAYKPATVEAGLYIPALNNIFYAGGPTPSFQLKFWNTGDATNVVARYKVVDMWDRTLIETNVTVSLAAGTNTTQSINLPATNGWLRVVTRLPAFPDSYDEAPVVVYPFASTASVGWLGGHPNFSPFSASLMLSNNWLCVRTLSPDILAGRWSQSALNFYSDLGNYGNETYSIEYVPDTFTFVDAVVTNFTRLGMDVLIPLTTADGTWPYWATNGDGSANFMRASNFVYHTVRRYNVQLGLSNQVAFELWNEPYQSGPTTPTNLRYATNYASLLHYMIAGATNAHAGVRLVAMGGSTGDNEWTWQVWTNLTAQEQASIIAISHHEYPQQSLSAAGDPNYPESGTANRPEGVVEKFGGIVPIWQTESGWYRRPGRGLNSLYPTFYYLNATSADLGYAEAYRGESMMRSTIELARGLRLALRSLGVGYSRYYYYDNRAQNDSSFDPAQSQPYAADFLSVNKSEQVALAVAQSLIVAPGLGRITNALDWVEMFMFTNAAGNPVVAAWSAYMTNATITVTNSAFETLDPFANRLGSNQAVVVTGRDPYYFRSETLTVEQMSNTFRFATTAPLADTNPPSIVFDVAPTAPWSGDPAPTPIIWQATDREYYAWMTTNTVAGTHTNVVSRWKLDGGGWSAWSASNHNHFANLSAGNHTLTVAAKDRAGNESTNTYAFNGSVSAAGGGGITMRVTGNVTVGGDVNVEGAE